MKLFRSISLNKNVCPPDFYADIAQLYPGGTRSPLTFHLEAQPDDEEAARTVEHIAALCKQSGLDKVRGAYSQLVMPCYEEADLQAAPLLRLVGQRKLFKGLNSNKRDATGRIVLLATEAKASITIASIFPEPWIVVSSGARRLLETADLIGIEFEEVAVKGHSIYAAPEPFWELRSTITLTKMANSVIYPEPAYGHTAYTIQDPYVEPHYRETELASLGLFDIANTFERSRGGSRLLIVSQRFYRHCLTHKIPLRVKPVRVDPDSVSP